MLPIPGISTGGGGFSGSSGSSAGQTQTFSTGGNQGLSFGATSDGWKLGLGVAGLALAALLAYRAGKRRRG